MSSSPLSIVYSPMSLRERLRTLDPVIVGITLGLTLVGLIVLMSASGPVAFQRTGDSFYYVKHQLLSGILPGAILFFFFALIDLRRWKRAAFLALIVSIVLLVLVYIPGIGVIVNGARGWVQLGPIRVQPSEFVKLTFLIYLSAWLASRKGSEAHDPETGLLPFLISVGSVMLLLVLQPDTGSMGVIVGTSVLLYFASGAPVMWFAGLCGAGLGFLWILIKLSPYRAARFMTFMHPELDPRGIGYHINQAYLAIGSGGWFGLGYGHSRQKFLYLPEVESDSIVAVFAEEMGWLVTAGLIIVYGILIWRCLMIAREQRDRFTSFIALGVGCWLGIQIFMNIGSMAGLVPITGVTLPFFSNGGSAMTVILAAMGMVAGLPRLNSSRERL